MKRLLITFLMISMIIGCNNSLNSPSNKVISFLDKYKNLDDKVLQELEYQIESKNYNEKEKELYRNSIRRQYQNLKYKILEEKEYENTATVKVEIEVYNYIAAIEKASNYFLKNQELFINDDNIVDESKYIDYKLNEIEKTNERINYIIEFNLYKKNKIWYLRKIDNETLSKINGLYSD